MDRDLPSSDRRTGGEARWWHGDGSGGGTAAATVDGTAVAQPQRDLSAREQRERSA